ncbi:amidase family protein [Pseudoalteromonas sp. C2R02]|uniref:amidase family protein n=1 Tax=Pseudoalteromonas sp. C2R02 TaxID=2841565 RepID=UPI00339D6E9B
MSFKFSIWYCYGCKFTLLAVGTETHGSVTCPSAVNGIVGLKSTLGTISRSGIFLFLIVKIQLVA